jgi:nucleotide-binding universal stress UspA family protein
MTVFQRVLVAVDGSPASLHAFEQALRLGGDTVAIAVTPKAPALGPKAHDQVLAQAAALAQAAGVSLETLSDQGEPHERIAAAAESAGSNLIVVGLKGRGLPAAALMGSTTARVIGFSPMDVLVVPEPAGISLKKILLPTDGSRYSQKAAARALEICAARGGELKVIAVLDAPPGFLESAPQVAADLLAGLEKITAEVQGRAQELGLACQAEVLQGPAYQAITGEAGKWQAGLIVMGSHGRTGLKRLLMGSVTERVIGFAPCPVLVVKGRA